MRYFRRSVTPMQPEARLPSEAIAEIVRKEGPYLQRVLLKCGVHERDVEDELQGVWERATAKQVSGSIRGWLVRMAVGRAANYRQRLKRQLARQLAMNTVSDRNRDPEEQSIADQLCDRSPNPEQLVTAAEVARLVEQLDPKLRAVTVAFIDGETTKEISERLHIPEGTVSTRLRLARTRIKRVLGRGNGQRR